MTESPRLQAVIFDVNETLFSLDRMRGAFAEAGLDPGAVPLWFARTLRDGFALCEAGGWRPFAEVAASAMRDVTGASLQTAREVLSHFSELDPHPDVEPALRRLRDAGVRVATLTVGAREVTDALLARAGLTEYVERTMSADAVRRWKPAREPYAWAVGRLGVEPSDAALVAAHAWDVHGARAAGLRTGWVSRLEGRPSAVFDRADVEGDDLVAVVDRLLGAG